MFPRTSDELVPWLAEHAPAADVAHHPGDISLWVSVDGRRGDLLLFAFPQSGWSVVFVTPTEYPTTGIYPDDSLLVTVVRTWCTPGLTTVQAWRAIGTCLNRIADKSGATLAHQVFRRGLPERDTEDVSDDGRYTLAGFTEPYPGSWPSEAITAAQAGDLSALWPCLGEPVTGTGEHSTGG